MPLPSASVVSYEKPAVIPTISPSRWDVSLPALSNLCFSFQKVYDVPWCGFLWTYSGVQSASWVCRFISFAKFAKFSVIISLSTFLGLPDFSFPSRTWMTWMIDLLYSPGRSWHWSFKFFLLFRLGYFCCSYLQVQWFFPLSSQLMSFNFSYHILSATSLLKLSIFSFVSYVFRIAYWNIFMMNALKTLVR